MKPSLKAAMFRTFGIAPILSGVFCAVTATVASIGADVRAAPARFGYPARAFFPAEHARRLRTAVGQPLLARAGLTGAALRQAATPRMATDAHAVLQCLPVRDAADLPKPIAHDPQVQAGLQATTEARKAAQQPECGRRPSPGLRAGRPGSAR